MPTYAESRVSNWFPSIFWRQLASALLKLHLCTSMNKWWIYKALFGAWRLGTIRTHASLVESALTSTETSVFHLASQLIIIVIWIKYNMIHRSSSILNLHSYQTYLHPFTEWKFMDQTTGIDHQKFLQSNVFSGTILILRNRWSSALPHPLFLQKQRIKVKRSSLPHFEAEELLERNDKRCWWPSKWTAVRLAWGRWVWDFTHQTPPCCCSTQVMRFLVSSPCLSPWSTSLVTTQWGPF